MRKKNYVAFSILFLLMITPSISHGMHIMEGFLPVKWAMFWGVLSIPFIILGFKRLNELFKKDANTKILLGLAGGFVFVLSALKIPSVTGSCSHPTGVGLGAILFGPMVMSILGSIVLLFQSILLAHGGLTTLGANVFSMAIVGPIVSYIIFKSLKNTNKGLAVFLAASLGDLVTYCITALQLSLAFPDPAAGFMGSLIKFLSVFAVTQVPLAIVEGLLTVIVYNLLMDYKDKGVISIENI